MVVLFLFAFISGWDIKGEYSSSQKGSTLELDFYADKVYLVITPETMKDAIKVFFDGKFVNNDQAGSDVKDGYVQLKTDNLDDIYNLIDLKGNPGEHILRLEFEPAGTKIYAFTFG